MDNTNYKFMLKKLNSKPDKEFEFFRILDNNLRDCKELNFANNEFTNTWNKAFTLAAMESKNSWLSEFHDASTDDNKQAINEVFLNEYLNFWRA